MSACAQHYHILELRVRDGDGQKYLLDFKRDNCQFFAVDRFKANIVCMKPDSAIKGMVSIIDGNDIQDVEVFELDYILYSISTCIKGALEIQKFKHKFKRGTTILEAGSDSGDCSGKIIAEGTTLFIPEALEVLFEVKKLGDVFDGEEGTQFIS